MRISVIIPVYNAARYVERAVRSALDQPDTAEIILVEDGSPDGSLELCRRLADAHANVRLVRHPDGRNHGAGASRSLGVLAAQGEWIAFLDADDFFLPGRFTTACRLIEADPSLDGVCDCVGVHYDTEKGRERAEATGRHLVITFDRPVGPEEMFAAHMPVGEIGYFHLNGLVVRRSAVMRAGLFCPQLRLHQDTEFAVRLTAVARLTTGVLDPPVALRGMHDTNRISADRSVMQRYWCRVMMYKYLYRWGRRELEPERLALLDHAVAKELGPLWTYSNCRLLGRWQVLRQLAMILWVAPGLLRCPPLMRRLWGRLWGRELGSGMGD